MPVQQLMHAIVLVHKMQRLALSTSNSCVAIHEQEGGEDDQVPGASAAAAATAVAAASLLAEEESGQPVDASVADHVVDMDIILPL